jgi:hypothetical protein
MVPHSKQSTPSYDVLQILLMLSHLQLGLSSAFFLTSPNQNHVYTLPVSHTCPAHLTLFVFTTPVMWAYETNVEIATNWTKSQCGLNKGMQRNCLQHTDRQTDGTHRYRLPITLKATGRRDRGRPLKGLLGVQTGTGLQVAELRVG